MMWGCSRQSVILIQDIMVKYLLLYVLTKIYFAENIVENYLGTGTEVQRYRADNVINSFNISLSIGGAMCRCR